MAMTKLRDKQIEVAPCRTSLYRQRGGAARRCWAKRYTAFGLLV
jgi:hypothetical protein